MTTLRESWAARIALVVLGVFAIWGASCGEREEVDGAAEKTTESVVAAENATARPEAPEVLAVSERVPASPRTEEPQNSAEIWQVTVRAVEAGGAEIAVEEGSLTVLVTRRDGPLRRVAGHIENGLWSAELPCPVEQITNVELWAARVGDRRFVAARRAEKFEAHFDGSDLLVLEPAPPTFVRVVDPRTGELAGAAELFVSTDGEFDVPEYRLTFSVPVAGEPVCIDRLQLRDLEELRHVHVRARIDGVGEASGIVELGSGADLELSPEIRGSVRVTWHLPADFEPRAPELLVRPLKLERPLPEGSGAATRVERLRPSFFDKDSHKPGPYLAPGPVQRLVEHLPAGEYVAEVTAELHVSAGRMSLGSAPFTVRDGEVTEVAIDTVPRESDPWRLLRVELTLPALTGEARLEADLVPRGLGALRSTHGMPGTLDGNKFGLALVRQGRHEFALHEPLPFSLEIDVTRVPEHVERVDVPWPAECRIDFIAASNGEWLRVSRADFEWRTCSGTSLDPVWRRLEPGLNEGQHIALAPASAPIELRAKPEAAWRLAAGETLRLASDGPHQVELRAQPRVVLVVTLPPGLERAHGCEPRARTSAGAPWAMLHGRWEFPQDPGVARFTGWLPAEGSFEITLACGDTFEAPPPQVVSLQLDESRTLEFKLESAR